MRTSKDKQGHPLEAARPETHVCSLLPPGIIFTRGSRVGPSWFLRPGWREAQTTRSSVTAVDPMADLHLGGAQTVESSTTSPFHLSGIAFWQHPWIVNSASSSISGALTIQVKVFGVCPVTGFTWHRRVGRCWTSPASWTLQPLNTPILLLIFSSSQGTPVRLDNCDSLLSLSPTKSACTLPEDCTSYNKGNMKWARDVCNNFSVSRNYIHLYFTSSC